MRKLESNFLGDAFDKKTGAAVSLILTIITTMVLFNEYLKSYLTWHSVKNREYLFINGIFIEYYFESNWSKNVFWSILYKVFFQKRSVETDVILWDIFHGENPEPHVRLRSRIGPSSSWLA